MTVETTAQINAKTEIPLNSGWKFREVNKTGWLPAIVPGRIHTDLLGSKKIEDPFYRDNEKNIQRISDRSWERENIKLVFKGIDTSLVFPDYHS